MRDVDYVIHAAALKQVPTADSIRSNASAPMCRRGKCGLCRAAPQCAQGGGAFDRQGRQSGHLYGASKLSLGQDLRRRQQSFGRGRDQVFGRALRQCGGLARQRGAVLPEAGAGRRGEPAHHRRAHDAVLDHADARRELRFVEHGDDARGEIFVPKIASTTIVDLASLLGPNIRQKVVGIGPARNCTRP